MSALTTLVEQHILCAWINWITSLYHGNMHFHCRQLLGRDRHRRGDKIMRAETSAQKGRFRTVYAFSAESGLPGKTFPPGEIIPVQYLRGRTWGGAVLQRNTGSRHFPTCIQMIFVRKQKGINSYIYTSHTHW